MATARTPYRQISLISVVYLNFVSGDNRNFHVLVLLVGTSMTALTVRRSEIMAQAHFKLQSMNVDALLKLREDIGKVLSQKGQELKRQLQRLGGLTRASGSHPRKGMKVAPKYRGPNGETWAGRGAMPKWLAALKKDGHKPEKFLIAKPAKTAASQRRSRSAKSARKRK
jgi:DNA-binding protein H-NS